MNLYYVMSLKFSIYLEDSYSEALFAQVLSLK